MRELRISIPFIGGITAIYTEAEVKQMKAKAKENTVNKLKRIKELAKATTSVAAGVAVVTGRKISEAASYLKKQGDEYIATRSMKDKPKA